MNKTPRYLPKIIEIAQKFLSLISATKQIRKNLCRGSVLRNFAVMQNFAFVSGCFAQAGSRKYICRISLFFYVPKTWPKQQTQWDSRYTKFFLHHKSSNTQKTLESETFSIFCIFQSQKKTRGNLPVRYYVHLIKVCFCTDPLWRYTTTELHMQEFLFLQVLKDFTKFCCNFEFLLGILYVNLLILAKGV